MFKYENININYQFTNNNKKLTLIYLHGWGQNIAMMEPIAKSHSNCNTLIIDLPGHGQSEEPKRVWSLEDFADMVNSLVKELKLKDVVLIGHSFGGKISIIYASKYEVKKLVLLASPYKIKIKKPSFKVRVLKKLAKVPILGGIANSMKVRMGSLDYRNATPMMRNILVKHVNTDTTELCKKIKCPTIIIWGDNDTTVSIDDAYEIEKLIKDSAVIVYPNGSHFAYLEDVNKTNRIIDSFVS
ncbi:MAG: alpha/beta fold hydrolase [Bacilli bacterium]